MDVDRWSTETDMEHGAEQKNEYFAAFKIKIALDSYQVLLNQGRRRGDVQQAAKYRILKYLPIDYYLQGGK